MPETIVCQANGRAHPLYSRDEWRARPPRTVRRMPAPQRRKFVHYTVTPAGGDEPTLAQSIAGVRAVQAFHMDTRGWSDIAYNVAVDNAGRCFIGRGPRVVGGHTQGYNSTSVAVVWLGMPGDTFTEGARSGIRAALEWLDRLDGVHTPTDGHRDVASTGCPGDPAWAWVHAGMPVTGTTPPPPNPQELTMADVATILARLDALDAKEAATAAELTRLRNDVGAWLQGERLFNGTAGYRVEGHDAVHVLRFDAAGPFLVRLSPALYAGLQGRGDLDPFVLEVPAGSELATELAAMRGFDPR